MTRNVIFFLALFVFVYRAMTISRPVVYDQLTSRLREMYQMTLNIFYTQSNGEVRTALSSKHGHHDAIQDQHIWWRNFSDSRTVTGIPYIYTFSQFRNLQPFLIHWKHIFLSRPRRCRDQIDWSVMTLLTLIVLLSRSWLDNSVIQMYSNIMNIVGRRGGSVLFEMLAHTVKDLITVWSKYCQCNIYIFHLLFLCII